MHIGGQYLEQAQQTVMATNQPEDFIAKQGTYAIRLWIDLTNIINDQGMKIATLDGYNGQRFTESWRPNGYSCYDHNSMAWLAQFSAAIAHEEFKLSSLKPRMKLNQMMQRMPDPR